MLSLIPMQGHFGAVSTIAQAAETEFLSVVGELEVLRNANGDFAIPVSPEFEGLAFPSIVAEMEETARPRAFAIRKDLVTRLAGAVEIMVAESARITGINPVEIRAFTPDLTSFATLGDILEKAQRFRDHWEFTKAVERGDVAKPPTRPSALPLALGFFMAFAVAGAGTFYLLTRRS